VRTTQRRPTSPRAQRPTAASIRRSGDQSIPEAQAKILHGPLATAVAGAADYAGDALSERSEAACKLDWIDICG
jgi:hypothetical protein